MEKAVVLVTNISNNLIGKKICGFTLRKVYRGCDEICEYLNKKLRSWEFADILLGYNTYILDNQPDVFLHSDELGKYYLYFQKENVDDKSIDIFIETDAFVKSMAIFKVSGISFTHPHIFSDKHGTGILSSSFHNYYSLNDWPEFNLEDNEILKLEEFYELYKKIDKNKKIIDRMIDLWMTSRRTPSFDIKFILHVTILEMFINGNTKLSYRLSRSIAVLLGNSRENSKEIYNNVKKLYNARSRFLHDGEENKKNENEINAQNYARKLIVELIMLSSEYKKSIDDIRAEIDKFGFGDYKLLVASLNDNIT